MSGESDDLQYAISAMVQPLTFICGRHNACDVPAGKKMKIVGHYPFQELGTKTISPCTRPPLGGAFLLVSYIIVKLLQTERADDKTQTNGKTTVSRLGQEQKFRHGKFII